MFLWCIINQTTAKANATITNIVRKINNLRELMIEKDSDVQSFNTTVRQLVNSYYANKREQVDKETLLANLFDA
jgi:iron-sulfur cluster repair protein YtfE (RIC family)